MSDLNSKRPATKVEAKEIIKKEVEAKKQKKHKNFVRQLISDNNDINESSIAGFICFILFVIIIVADIISVKPVVGEIYVKHLVTLIVAFFGVGGAVKGFKEMARKTVTYEVPE